MARKGGFPVRELRQGVAGEIRLDGGDALPGLLRVTDDDWLQAECLHPLDEEPRGVRGGQPAATVISARTGLGTIWLNDPTLRRAVPSADLTAWDSSYRAPTGILWEGAPPSGGWGRARAAWDDIGNWAGTRQWQPRFGETPGRIAVELEPPDPKKFSGAGRTVHLSTRWALDPSSGGEPKTLHSTTVFTIDGQTAGPAETLTELGAIRWLLTICHQQARPATAVEVYLDESKEWAPAYSRRLMSPSRWAGTPEARPALARLNDLGDDPLNPWIDLANAVPRFPGVLAFPFDTGPLPFEADLLAMGSALEAWGKRLNKAGVLPRQRPWPVSIAASVLTGNNAPLARPWGCQFWQAYLGMKHQFTVGAPREGNATVTVARLVLAASLLSMVSGRPEAAARFVGSPSSKQALAELDALGIVQRHRLECLKCK